MLKKISHVLLVVVALVFVTGILSMPVPVLAQDGTGDPNAPVSNIDGDLPTPESSGSVGFAPFAGTGKLSTLSGTRISTASSPVDGAHSESVIGTDERRQVGKTTDFPNRAIAYLYVVWRDNTAGSCSGWFIGPRTVVTAGHCVYSAGNGGFAKRITIYPGRSRSSIPYGFTTSHRLFAVKGWRDSANPDYDYGAIQTNDTLGNTVGWFNLKTQVSDTFSGNYAVRGYPGDKPPATMWTMSGAITNANMYRLWYSMDTFGGESGSPLFAAYNGVCCSGFGVHTYGTSLSPYFGNSATRITQTVYNNLVAWRNVAYP